MNKTYTLKKIKFSELDSELNRIQDEILFSKI